MTNEKAYIMGLLVAGGTIGNGTFTIRMPLHAWGNATNRAGNIARAILNNMTTLFNTAYGLNVTYSWQNIVWNIVPVSAPGSILQRIQSDLSQYGLPTTDVLLNSADLSTVKSTLTTIEAEWFLTGVFDARASVTVSHRRFIASAPIVSIEIPGSTKNFAFVVQLCSWLSDKGTHADQILYNHPSQQAKDDPSYMGWKKGFKLRVMVSTFIAANSFQLRPKAQAIQIALQNQTASPQPHCSARNSNQHAKPVCIHNDIHSTDLPFAVRSKVFFQYHHICEAMNCPHVPSNEVSLMANRYNELVFPFPKLLKDFNAGSKQYYGQILKKHFVGERVKRTLLSVMSLIQTYGSDFPKLKSGLAFLFSASLNGKRPVGPQSGVLSTCQNSIVSILHFVNINGGIIYVLNPSNQRNFIVSSSLSSLPATLSNRIVRKNGNSIEVL